MNRHFAYIALLCLLFSATTEANVSAQQQSVAKLTGVFEFVGGDKERTGISKAILIATDSLNRVIKRLATNRLTETTRPYASLRLEMNEQSVRAWLDQHGPWETAIGGQWFSTTTRDGRRVKVKHRIIQGRLVQTIKARGGTRTNTFRPTVDGEGIRMHVRIESPRLSDPVDFELTYRRVNKVTRYRPFGNALMIALYPSL